MPLGHAERLLGNRLGGGSRVQPFDEFLPSLSPDGRWLAYNTNESGRNEVYLRPFPDTRTGKWQLTTEGGPFQLEKTGAQYDSLDFDQRDPRYPFAHEIQAAAGAIAIEDVRERRHVSRELLRVWRRVGRTDAVRLEIRPDGGVIPRVQHLDHLLEAPDASGLRLRQRCRIRLHLLGRHGGRDRHQHQHPPQQREPPRAGTLGNPRSVRNDSISMSGNTTTSFRSAAGFDRVALITNAINIPVDVTLPSEVIDGSIGHSRVVAALAYALHCRESMAPFLALWYVLIQQPADQLVAYFDSGIKGGDGNREFFMLCQKP